MRGALPLGLLFAVGCYAPDIEPGGACVATCPGDLVCVSGLCLDPESSDDPTLVARWRFDDPPGDGALDSSGHGHHATCETCPALVAGKVGGGYRFTGKELLVVPDHADFRGRFTIAAWINSDKTFNQISALAKPFGGGTSNSWQLEVLDNDLVSLSGGEPHYLDSDTVKLSEQAWHHVAGTWDEKTKQLYVDGVLVNSTEAYVAYDTHAVVLGGDQNSDQDALFWEGVLDELRIYNRALTPAEIAALAK